MALNLDKKFIAVLILAIKAILLTVVAYASPHWIDSFSQSNNPFLNCGIWEICWNDYTFPLDHFGRRFVGCFWVLGRDLYEFRDIILKGWFIGVIVVFTVQLALQVVLSIILTFSFIGFFSNRNQYGIDYACAGCFTASACLSFIGLVIYGVGKEDRKWMYRPDQNHLSWAYGLAAVVMKVNIIAAVIMFFIAKKNKEKQLLNRAYGVNKGGRW